MILFPGGIGIGSFSPALSRNIHPIATQETQSGANISPMETTRIASLLHREGELFHRLDQLEFHHSKSLNRLGRLPPLRRLLASVSRLGDGFFWYLLMTAIFLLGGRQGMVVAGHMGFVAILCLAIYKGLKNVLLRPRPFITHADIYRLTAPLDYYSFPSGHTLHAVAFTVVSGTHYPMLLWVTAPFTMLVALSRVTLGLHYPSDVIAGAAIGALLAVLSFPIL